MYNLCIRSAASPGYRGEELFPDDTFACVQTGSPLARRQRVLRTLEKHLSIDRVLLGAVWLKDMHAAHTGKCSFEKIGFPVSCSN